MDVKLIRDTTLIYFKNLFKEYRTPIGYHDLKVTRDPSNIIVITLESLTDDVIINMIPRIKKRYTIIFNALISVLRDLTFDYDFSIRSIEFTVVKMTMNLNMFQLYLNLYLIPVELISEIIKYIDPKNYRDYFSLMEVIKLKKYPKEIIKVLKREYDIYYDPFYGNELKKISIVTIDDVGTPIKIDRMTNGSKIIEEKIYNFSGDFISSKRWDKGELKESLNFSQGKNMNVNMNVGKNVMEDIKL